MSHEVIHPDNTLLLMKILGDVENRTYIEVVKQVQEQVKENLPPAEAPVTNHFAPHVYMRQMDAAAGTIVISKMHRTEHLNILLKGSVTVVTENGIEYLKAPLILCSKPGTKRIGYFHEDSSWVTVHPTDLTDVDEIEKEVIVPEEEIDAFLLSIGHEPKEFKICHGEQ